MYTNNAEAAYCKGRIERSTALAIASTESCARLSHEGMAALYERKLTGLIKSSPTAPSNLITLA
jgi:hypothetical protein